MNRSVEPKLPEAASTDPVLLALKELRRTYREAYDLGFQGINSAGADRGLTEVLPRPHGLLRLRACACACMGVGLCAVCAVEGESATNVMGQLACPPAGSADVDSWDTPG